MRSATSTVWTPEITWSTAPGGPDCRTPADGAKSSPLCRPPNHRWSGVLRRIQTLESTLATPVLQRRFKQGGFWSQEGQCHPWNWSSWHDRRPSRHPPVSATQPTGAPLPRDASHRVPYRQAENTSNPSLKRWRRESRLCPMPTPRRSPVLGSQAVPTAPCGDGRPVARRRGRCPASPGRIPGCPARAGTGPAAGAERQPGRV